MKRFGIGIHEICAFFIIIFAVALRIILVSQGWPQTNSDEGTLGLMAKHIAYQGEHPIFFYGQGYMGPFEAYLAAILFQLFGPSLFALRLALIIIFALFLVSTYLLTSLLYTRKLALVTLSLLSLGSVGILYVQLRAIGGYAETLLFGSLLLLLATWLALSYKRNLPDRRRWLRFAIYGCYGYLVGLSIWTDLLIMPFVLMSAILLLLFCWSDLDTWAPTCVIASFILGILPLFVYNITALPQQSSLFYFLLVYRSDPTGQALKQVPLVQKMLGALLVGLPNATGANPICYTQNLPFFGLFSSSSLHCTLLQGSWAIGCILLWCIAVFLTVKALWKLRQQFVSGEQVPGDCGPGDVVPGDPCGRQEQRRQAQIVRYFARLMLLGSAALTLLLFALSPVAALDPWTNSRYLICLLIATPAIIAPLCGDEMMRIGRDKSAVIGINLRNNRRENMNKERFSRRGGSGVDVEHPVWGTGIGPLWPPAVPFWEGAQDGQENPLSGIPVPQTGFLQGAPLPVPQTGSHPQPPLPLRVPCLRFLRLMRIERDKSDPYAAGSTFTTWPAKVLTVIKAAILLFIAGMILIGTVSTFNDIPAVQAVDQQQENLITDLLHIGATRIYSEYWTCDRIIFQSNERIICSVVNDRLRPGYNRYQPYYFMVKRSYHPAFVFPLGSPVAANFARRVVHLRQRYRRFIFDGYVIYQPQ